MPKWLFDDTPNVAVVTTRSVVRVGAWIARVSLAADDGSWRLLESAPGARRVVNATVVALTSMVLRDRTLNEPAGLPGGWRAWRDKPPASWQQCTVG